MKHMQRYNHESGFFQLFTAALPEGFPEERTWKEWAQNIFTELFSDCPEETPEAGRKSIAAFFEQPANSRPFKLLIPHIKHRPHPRHADPRGEGALQALWTLLNATSPDETVSAQEFIEAALIVPEIPNCLHPDYAADFVYFESRGHYSNYLGDSGLRAEQRYLDTNTLYRQALLVPMVTNALGVWAITGLIEIEYRPPRNGFTPWSGICEFRLSPWGAYVTGKSESPPYFPPTKAIRLSASSEIAHLVVDSPRARELLNSGGTEIAPGAFRLSKSGILETCSRSEDLRDFLSALRDLSEDPLPPLWEEFFRSLHDGQVYFEEIPEQIVVKVPPRRELLQLLKEDSAFDNCILRAEEGHIIIHRAQLSRFFELLKQRGFLPLIADPRKKQI